MENIYRRTINANPKKSRRCWVRLPCLLSNNNISSRASNMFYKAVVIVFVLYVSEI